MATQAAFHKVQRSLIKDASEKGITKTPDSISLTAKTAIETLVGVRRCDFRQKTTQVSKFPRNASIIKAKRKIDPMTISTAVNTVEA